MTTEMPRPPASGDVQTEANEVAIETDGGRTGTRVTALQAKLEMFFVDQEDWRQYFLTFVIKVIW